MKNLNYSLENFQPQHDYLICVDSDGCGMDTMTIKHERAFGPALLDIWNLDDMKEQVLERWNQFNLYEITRGINRFQGLEKMLTELHSKVALLMAIMILKSGSIILQHSQIHN